MVSARPLAAAALVAATLTAPAAGAGCVAPVAWTELHYRARKLLLTATAAAHLETVPAERATGDLRRSPAGPGRAPSGPCVAVLTLVSDVPVGRDERATAWLDAVDGGILQVDKVATGRGAFRKVFRFGDAGFFMWRSAPADGREEAGDAAGWSRRKTASITVAHPEDGGVLTDSYALLYQLSLVPRERAGAVRRAVMFADDRLAEVSFAAGGLSLREVDHTVAWPGGRDRRRGDRLLRQVTVAAAPFGATSAGDQVDLGFLGMKGELTVWLDMETGVPVEMEGRAEAVGRLRVTLEHATLRDVPGGSGGGS